MKVMLQAYAEDTIRADLGSQPGELAAACLSIVRFIATEDMSHLGHITFGALSEVIGAEARTELVVGAIGYLTGARVPLLDPRFEFIEDDLIEPVSETELAEARASNIFYHPHTGLPVEDFESKLVLYFVPSAEAGEMRSSL